MAERDTFATVINCMDGRVQVPVTDWMVKTFGVRYVDVVTEPGPIKVLAERTPGIAENIRRRVEISVQKHGSRIVGLVAHGDCAGNPIPKAESLEQLRVGIDVIRSWGLPVTVVGLWLGNPEWEVEQVLLIEPD